MKFGSRAHQRMIDDAVATGPDCLCGHARSLHCPPGFFDGMCQVEGCPCTPAGYLFADGSPYFPPDVELLQERGML